ncbi:unnamed protein product, partial [Meganyctiphanes norvegica]
MTPVDLSLLIGLVTVGHGVDYLEAGCRLTKSQTANQAESISDLQSSYSNVKNASHTVQHLCSSQDIPRTIVMIEQFTKNNGYTFPNSDDIISNSYIPSSLSESNVHGDSLEDARTRGQLIQEISRVIEEFVPYSSASVPSRSSHSSNIPISNSQQTEECNYVSPNGTSNWIWTRAGGSSDNRVINPSGNTFFTETNQATEVGNNYHYDHVSDETEFSGHISSLTSTCHLLPSVTTPRRDTPHPYIITSSALDLSPSQGSISAGTSTSKTHDLEQFRGCNVNCNQSPPPAAHLQPSLLQHLDLRPHQLEDQALDMVTNETSHIHPSITEKVKLEHLDLRPHQLEGTALDMVASHKLHHSEASHTHAPLTDKLNYATAHRNIDETFHKINSCGIKSNNDVHESNEDHEKIIPTGPYDNTQRLKDEINGQQQHINIKGESQIEDSFKCGECGASFSNMKHLICHMKVHELIPLPLSLKNKGKHENIQHQQQIVENDKYQYKCDKCDNAYTTKLLLLRHKKIHSKNKLYSCNECPTVLTEAGSLKLHKRLHSGEKPFKCSVCPQAFSGAGLLATHTRKHTGNQSYFRNVVWHRQLLPEYALHFIVGKTFYCHVKHTHIHHVIHILRSFGRHRDIR